MVVGRWHRALTALCLAIVCTGCGSADGDSTGSCQDVRMNPTDVGFFVAFGWDESEIPFGQPAPLLVCVAGTGRVRVSLAADPGITVTPGELPNNGEKLALRFQVTVQPGTTGRIVYTQTSVSSGSVLHTGLSMDVTSSRNGWRFRKPD